ncbi:uncharacterized protein LOC109603820 isoform X2 [Aethina tumida]|uniref:uncharacterized protein LOC109603820 isoform X2 n=1 Tax=Aethina tumida TaxID=116153 RepID=UPI00096ADCA5|nr:uncharacterized protein LOC109603820 isoform X2 [Aethina tumida]
MYYLKNIPPPHFKDLSRGVKSAPAGGQELSQVALVEEGSKDWLKHMNERAAHLYKGKPQKFEDFKMPTPEVENDKPMYTDFLYKADPAEKFKRRNIRRKSTTILPVMLDKKNKLMAACSDTQGVEVVDYCCDKHAKYFRGY